MMRATDEETAMTPEELRALRADHNLTQKALGAILGYNENYIYRLERGKVPITDRFATLVRLKLGRKKRTPPA